MNKKRIAFVSTLGLFINTSACDQSSEPPVINNPPEQKPPPEETKEDPKPLNAKQEEARKEALMTTGNPVLTKPLIVNTTEGSNESDSFKDPDENSTEQKTPEKPKHRKMTNPPKQPPKEKK